MQRPIALQPAQQASQLIAAQDLDLPLKMGGTARTAAIQMERKRNMKRMFLAEELCEAGEERMSLLVAMGFRLVLLDGRRRQTGSYGKERASQGF